MSDKEFNEIFAKNLRFYLEINNMTQVELAKRLGVGQTSVYNWTNGIKTPRMDKVDAMCKMFGCTRTDLITDHSDQDGFYTNPETAKVARELASNPDLMMLFDATKDASPEDLRRAAEMIKLFLKK